MAVVAVVSLFQVDFSLSGQDDVFLPTTPYLEWNYLSAEEEIMLGPGKSDSTEGTIHQCYITETSLRQSTQ